VSLDRRDLSIRGLHLVLGAVLLLGASLEVTHARVASDAAQGLPPVWARLTIAWTEIVAAVLFLVTPTLRIGALLLLAVLASAVAIHLAHGQSPAALVVYAAAVLVVLVHRGGRSALVGGVAD
jgi:hypothetical protein